MLFGLAPGVDGGAPLTVSPGGAGWNAFQVLAVGRDTAAVREVILAAPSDGAAEEARCANPGMEAVLRGRRGSEQLAAGGADGSEGVTLHLWALPPPGEAGRATGPREVVYRSGEVDGGCTSGTFDLFAPPRGDATQHTLEGVTVVSQDDTTFAIVTFSWVFLSARERVPVLVRLR
jgi:hypothetical protein